MPEYDDSKYRREDYERGPREVTREIGNSLTERALNFHWGRMLMLGVPAVVGTLGVFYFADHTIGERDRIKTAPSVPLSQLAQKIYAASAVTVTNEKGVSSPRYVEVEGHALYENTSIDQTTNGTWSVRTYKLLNHNSFTNQSSLGPTTLAASANPLQGANFSSAPTNNFTAETNSSIRFRIKERVDNPSPFPLFLQDQRCPVPVTLTLSTRPGKYLSVEGTNLLFTPLDIRNPE